MKKTSQLKEMEKIFGISYPGRILALKEEYEKEVKELGEVLVEQFQELNTQQYNYILGKKHKVVEIVKNLEELLK